MSGRRGFGEAGPGPWQPWQLRRLSRRRGLCEIRDEETAEIACRAAQVGRMVLSTLHTNSAEGAATRLAGLGVPEFVVREVLRGVLAQDLVGVWCRVCGDEGCAACAGRGREGAPVGRRLRVELKVG